MKPNRTLTRRAATVREILIERFKENPLLVPDSHCVWMSTNIFNPGVVIGDDGVWRMLVRGASTPDQSLSSLGLALSTDGIRWNLLSKPVLLCSVNGDCTFGIRDPRIVEWEGSYYVFVTVISSSDRGTRVGIFRTDNFFEYEWIGTPFDEVDANAAVFPQVINGWAYLLHRLPPHIRIARTRDLTLKGGWQDDQVLVNKNQFYLHPDRGVEPTKIGIAGPPIRTPKGWLVITHVVHRYDPKITKYSFLIHRSYSLSFMVLDIDDPTKILYVHDRPILWPEERHEIVGTVPNVVYSCATVDTGKDLVIYWGGADTVICGGRLPKTALPMCY